MILETLQWDPDGRLLPTLVTRKAPPWWKAPLEGELVSGAVLRHASRGVITHHGPFWRIGPFWFLCQGYDVVRNAHVLFPVNPVSVLIWPLWQAWMVVRAQVFQRALISLFHHGVFVVPDRFACQRARYRDLPKFFWFMPLGQEGRRERALCWRLATSHQQVMGDEEDIV